LIKKWLEKSIVTSQVIQINQTIRSLAAHIWISSQKIGKLLIAIARCKESLETINVPYSSLDLFPENSFQKMPQFEGSMRFTNICFSYKMNTEDEIRGGYLIENFNLFIIPNSRVALVGSSGSGKSTVFQLITRLIEPIKGKIEINGQDISKIGKKYLAQEFSFIPQKQLIFQRPLFENIGYGCEKIRNYFLQNPEKRAKFENLKTEIIEKIVEASKNADCHNFIINLKEGYNSIYGPEVGLSGGQLQRIMIARAFVNTDSKFLLLDEATSALDKSTEKTIKNSINKLSTNKTVIMIAHKLDLIKDFDRILVFDRGSIVEDGTHDELIALEGVYYKLAYLSS
jgi:ABC-type dipeptide/oligopeptide/nickel transport system ATPase component